jgi:hypothetical protein
MSQISVRREGATPSKHVVSLEERVRQRTDETEPVILSGVAELRPPGILPLRNAVLIFGFKGRYSESDPQRLSDLEWNGKYSDASSSHPASSGV